MLGGPEVQPVCPIQKAQGLCHEQKMESRKACEIRDRNWNDVAMYQGKQVRGKEPFPSSIFQKKIKNSSVNPNISAQGPPEL